MPDFRNKAERDSWRDDNWAQKRYDVKKGCFPAGSDPAITGRFSAVMADLCILAPAYRTYADWGKVRADMVEPGRYRQMADYLAARLDKILDTYRQARTIVDAYPASDGARVLREMLELGGEAEVLKPGFKAAVKRQAAALAKRFPEQVLPGWMDAAEMTLLQPAVRDIRRAAMPGRGLTWAPMTVAGGHQLDVRPAVQRRNGLVYIRGRLERKAGPGELRIGADGPFRAWVNGKPVGAVPRKSNPAIADEFHFPVVWKKGWNRVVVALNSNQGKAWGVMVHGLSRVTVSRME